MNNHSCGSARAFSEKITCEIERSVLFHALIVLDGLGGDGGGDLAGVGYLGVGSC